MLFYTFFNHLESLPALQVTKFIVCDVHDVHSPPLQNAIHSSCVMHNYGDSLLAAEFWQNCVTNFRVHSSNPSGGSYVPSRIMNTGGPTPSQPTSSESGGVINGVPCA
jgi:hypothetical protein